MGKKREESKALILSAVKSLRAEGKDPTPAVVNDYLALTHEKYIAENTVYLYLRDLVREDVLEQYVIHTGSIGRPPKGYRLKEHSDDGIIPGLGF